MIALTVPGKDIDTLFYYHLSLLQIVPGASNAIKNKKPRGNTP